MVELKKLEVWFITGSQHLYGRETLEQVAGHVANNFRIDAGNDLPIPADVGKKHGDMFAFAFEGGFLAVRRQFEGVAALVAIQAARPVQVAALAAFHRRRQ